jgi:prevent-host-death family protein
MDETLDAKDLKERLEAILDQVAKSASVTITREGEPIARLVPLGSLRDRLNMLQQQGFLHWSGRKPDWTGLPIPSDIEEHKGKSISDLILDDRE